MFQRKRRLKKERSKKRFKLLVFSLFIFLILVILAEYLYLVFPIGSPQFISPVAKNNSSKTAYIENYLQKEKIPFVSVTASSDASFIVTLLGGGEVILSSKKDFGSQISSLQLILSSLTIEGKKLKALDFRFDNPVVSFY